MEQQVKVQRSAQVDYKAVVVLLFSLSAAWALSLDASAAPSRRSEAAEGSISLKSRYEVREHRVTSAPANAPGTSNSPLDVWAVHRFEPRELNPARRRFVLERTLSLAGLQVVTVSDSSKVPAKKNYRVRLEGLESETVTHIREPGPWFEDLGGIACELKAEALGKSAQMQDLLSVYERSSRTGQKGYNYSLEPLHGTLDGTRQAAQKASDLWGKYLVDSLPQLSKRLSLIRESSESRALLRAEVALASWRDELETLYATRILTEARNHQREWEWDRVRKGQLCEGIGVPLRSPFLMATASAAEIQAQPGENDPLRRLLARVPARQVDGLFTVKVTLQFQDRKIVGKFLIDSSAPVSLVDPQWLGAQGVNPGWLKDTTSVPQRVTWSFGSGLAEPLVASFGLELGGTPLPTKLGFYALKMREELDQPERVEPCCDGVLGLDFLRSNLVEFQVGEHPAVQVWDPVLYRAPADYQGVEVWVTTRGELLSDCDWKDSSGKHLGRGVLWSVGQIAPIMNAPGKRSFSELKWSCEGAAVALQSGPRGAPLRGLPQLGAPVLGRGSFVLDLRRGKLWLDKKIFTSPLPKNRSGVTMSYGYREDEKRSLFESDRLIQVSRVAPGSAAEQQLSSLGFKAGVELLRINDRSTTSLDRWEIDQYFSGECGQRLDLEWAPQGLSSENRKSQTRKATLNLISG